MSFFDSIGDALGGVSEKWLEHGLEQISPPQHNPTPEATASVSDQIAVPTAAVEQPQGTAQTQGAAQAQPQQYMVPALIGGGFILLVLIAAVGGRK
ncbi:hypothetical protein [Oceanospirillum maris]|uniref:hypothetical protein n=1 Tax=Oceanospirillum maris TaxID=64977 RepID=UPI00040B5D79|nr:hypothetical protein [Oceanospirillum maris]